MSVKVKFKIGEKKGITANYTVNNNNPIRTIFRIDAASTAFSALKGSPYDNANLKEALDLKADKSELDADIAAADEAISNVQTVVENNYNTLDTKIDNVNSDLSRDISTLENTVNSNNTAVNNRIDVTNRNVSNLSTTVANNNTAINTRVDGIVNSFDGDISNLETAIQNEATTRANNDTLLQGDINTLRNDLTSEISNRTSADNTLQDNIDTLSSDLADEVTARENADTTLQGNINTLSNTVSSNYTTLNTKIDNTKSAIDSDISDLSDTVNQNYTDLNNAITTSASTINSRIDTEVNTLNTAITTENTQRQTADNNLQSQIDAITSASDVFDIVGTYAELQSYDISTVPPNDIIKVLVDSTHNNAATYYRCVENDGVKSWTYIGSEGAYYTKSEADNTFVAKTTTINNKPLSSNITLTASDVNALPADTVIGSGVITLQKNGVDVDSFNVNATANKSINISVPTDTSDLTNNAGYITGINQADVLDALGFTPYNASNPDGFITSSDLPTNYVTTDTVQDISGRKTFLGEKAIYFKQNIATDKLGFTLYNTSNAEVGGLEYRPNTINGNALLALNCPQTTGGYVGFRYWGTPAVNIVAPKVATAGNYFMATHITNGTLTVTANNQGTVNISSLLPDVSNYVTNTSLATTLADYVTNSALTTTLADYALSADIPNKTSDLTNDSGFITNSALAGFLQNTATGTNSLTISGTPTTNANAINIGYDSATNGRESIAIGYLAEIDSTNGEFSIAIGSGARTDVNSAIAIGSGADVYGTGGVSIGRGASANGSQSLALGMNANAMNNSSIQIGYGTNSDSNTLSVGFYNTQSTHYNWQLLDGITGLIPDARLSTNIQRTLVSGTDIKTVNNTSLLGSGNIVVANTDLSNLTNDGENRLHALKSYSDEGELLTDAEGLADVTNYAHSTFDLSKFPVVGSPTITADGIASGFSSSNYLTIPNLNLENADKWEIEGIVNVVSDASSSAGTWLSPRTGNGLMLPCTYFGTGGNIQYQLYLSSTNSSWDIADDQSISFPSGHTVKCNLKFTGTQYIYTCTDLDTNVVKNKIINSTAKVYQSPTQIGLKRNETGLTGSIDLKQFSITVDGKEVFNGNKEGLDVIKPDDYTVVGSPTITDDGVVSGFSNSDYITGSHSSITPTSSIELNCRVTLKSIPNATERIWSSQNDANFFLSARKDGSLGVRIKETSYDTGVSMAAGHFVLGEYVNIYAKITATNLYFKTTTQQGFTQERNITVSNPFTALSSFRFGIGGTYIGNPFTSGSIDLNSFKIYIDGNLVYQPCLKIPYTLSKTGSKIVQSVYRDRVNDMAEQFGSANYYTLNEDNGNFTLPQGEVYGMIEHKADVDLNNLSATGQAVIDGQWVKDNLTIASDVTWKTNTAVKTYSLSSYLPDDGYSYEVLFCGVAVTGTTSGNFVAVRLSTDLMNYTTVCEARTRQSASFEAQGSVILPVGTDRWVRQYSSDSGNANGTYTLYAVGYRRIGTNS